MVWNDYELIQTDRVVNWRRSVNLYWHWFDALSGGRLYGTYFFVLGGWLGWQSFFHKNATSLSELRPLCGSKLGLYRGLGLYTVGGAALGYTAFLLTFPYDGAEFRNFVKHGGAYSKEMNAYQRYLYH